VEAALRRSSLPGRSLVLEISERLAMQHVSMMRRSLDLLKGLGVRIAIDDFGTGYSSLASLRALPIDILKIDRSFVHGLGLSDADEEITETILAMSRALRLVSVAEGVETNAQLDILIAHGCRRAQGYLFGAPAVAAGVAKYVGAISLP
jgi:EAL domain-containing protein (putative c-di-GMP-specific phosphodiesterase class I)